MSYARDVLGHCDAPHPINERKYGREWGHWCTLPIEHAGDEHESYGVIRWPVAATS